MRNPEPAEPDRPIDIQLDIATSEMDRNVESPKIEPEEEIS